ncbi:MAG: 3'-5' exonuclease domain-containing protein 2, partial [Paludibacteraceae bacterium]|nr:3'-5' exonuclease domain-containing protein 2 [Paludibacteraceae bacterium]
MLSSISKEELEALPIATFKGKIILVDSDDKVAVAVNQLKKYRFLGFDTESKPEFRRGQQNKLALIQLSSPDFCCLFQLRGIKNLQPILELLADESILKIGLAVKDDFHSMKQFSFQPRGFVDIQDVAKNSGIEDMSLQKIYAIVFGEKILKKQRLSNWSLPTLSTAQKQYAALDAWSCL